MYHFIKTSKNLFPFFLLVFIVACKQSQTKVVSPPIVSNHYYQEQHRPQIHFTPEAKWMNDPNGMFYYKGKYHLFYQYYPDSTVWGPMHWGHAESENLVHWEHLPIGLYPDSIGCIFSGGAIVDSYNTSNLGSSENPPIVATFTHHDFVGEKAKTNDFQKQSIAYSLDGGYEWKKYADNPVIPNTEKIKDFRDPKVVWHEASQKWILTLAAYDRVKFYASSNLTAWEFLSDFAIEGDHRLWECPDLFPMKVEGKDEQKWVLIVSIQKEAPNEGTATSYFIGDFDGKIFNSDPQKQKWLDWGTDNYAFVTWNNIPEEDGRTLGIGWMSNWQYAQIVPTKEWRSAMTLARELKLHLIDSEYYLHSNPVKELESLRGETTTFQNLAITNEKTLTGSFDPSQAEYQLTLDLNKSSAERFSIKLQNDLGEYFVISFDKKEGQMYVDRTHSSNNKFSKAFYNKIHSAPLSFDSSNMDIRIIMDASSSEIFINEGAVNFTSIFFPSKKYDQVSLLTENGTVHFSNLKIYELNGIWGKNN